MNTPTPAKFFEIPGGPPKTQAARIFAKFGGVPRLHKALALLGKPRSITSLYRWTYERDRGGTDGLVPTKAMPDVLKAARLEGIALTPDDLSPMRSAP